MFHTANPHLRYKEYAVVLNKVLIAIKSYNFTKISLSLPSYSYNCNYRKVSKITSKICQTKNRQESQSTSMLVNSFRKLSQK